MAPQSLTKDFKEFLQCLNDHGVEYLLVGGHAVAWHGYPRATNDMDVWVSVNEANAGRLVRALTAFGFDVADLSAALFLRPDRIVRMGVPPNRIEIQTGISGVQFAECFARRVVVDVEGVPVNFIALEDLKANKRASGRHKDLADLDNLP